LRLLHITLRRLLHLAGLLVLLTAATFALASLIPGDFFTQHQVDPSVSADTIAGLRRTAGLDAPFHVQYFRWLQRFARIDLGRSLFYGAPVSSVVASALARSLWLGLPALLLGFGLGILFGTLHGMVASRRVRTALEAISTVALSLPTLILGLVGLLFAASTRLFPLGGVNSPDFPDGYSVAWLADRIRHMLLPVACLSIPVIATVERIQRTAFAGTESAALARAARSRGLSPLTAFIQYRLRPSLNPVLSTAGPVIAGVLSGSLVLEVLFSWPGLGKITYDALFNRDVELLLGCVVSASTLLVAANLLSDLLLAWLDPRTESGEEPR
jgi:peptide/nickel transport system permease protein